MSIYSMIVDAKKLRKSIASARAHIYICLTQDEVTEEVKEKYNNVNELLVVIGGWDGD